jgi:ketosteroid isomerase-like protein
MASYEMMRAHLDVVESGDFVAAEAYYPDDVTVHVAGSSPEAGTYHGNDEYNAVLGRLVGSVDSISIEEHDLLVSDDHAVALDTWHVQRNGEEHALNHVIIYHATGDKINELWIVAEDQAAEARVLA